MDTKEVNKILLELKEPLMKDLGIIMSNLETLSKGGVPGYIDLRSTTLEASIFLKRMSDVLAEME
jgi:hypothetical protein